ncbi:IscS subfamily cysteine desulfurase [Metabacillus fastidiosus]|uniref:IscS subfamily cysteine desulfurase n=1 Tax=Metabacillus fastidiosus TaxID=1458 RepID=UPI003AF1A60C
MMIYLDYAATTPMSDYALSIYMETAKNAFGNSNSLHDIGGQANDILQASRKIIANLIGGEENGVYFTSGGTEANILAVQSLLNGADPMKRHIITSSMEHSSLYSYFQLLEEKGYEISYAEADQYGYISLDALKKSIRDDTVLVSIQHGNSEIGQIQPIEDFGNYLLEKNILFHSDCVQTFGKVPLNVKKANVTAISISSHKVHGPKGVGAVHINPSVYWKSVLLHTTHENGFRPGTVNVPGIAAFAVAAREVHSSIDETNNHFIQLRNIVRTKLEPHEKHINIINNSSPYKQLNNIIALFIPGIEGQYIMLEANRYGYGISTGSACQIGIQAPSRTMTALGFNDSEAKQYVRISTGKATAAHEMEEFCDKLIEIIKNFKKN